MMDTMSVLQYDDHQQLYSPDVKLFSYPDTSDHPDIKPFNYPDTPDHHLQTTQSNTVLNNSPTYTPLEPLYPSAPPPTSNVQYMAPSTPTPHHTVYSYTNAPIYTELPPLHSVVYTHLKDEGIGSLSPGSSHRSSNSSPISAGSPTTFSTARECAKCTSKEGIFWYHTHYLCVRCEPHIQVSAQEAAVYPLQTNGSKRKRSSGASRDEVCTNCESSHSTLWRKSTSTGETVCNACGLYERLHNRVRPKSMRKDTIQTRKRKSKASQSPKVTKKVLKKSPKKLPEVPVDQHQYVPNYSLPPYQNIQMKTSHQTLPYVMPEMGTHHQQVFLNFRPEYNYRHDIYSPVSPNDIINVSSSVSDPSNGVLYTNC